MREKKQDGGERKTDGMNEIENKGHNRKVLRR